MRLMIKVIWIPRCVVISKRNCLFSISCIPIRSLLQVVWLAWWAKMWTAVELNYNYIIAVVKGFLVSILRWIMLQTVTTWLWAMASVRPPYAWVQEHCAFERLYYRSLKMDKSALNVHRLSRQLTKYRSYSNMEAHSFSLTVTIAIGRISNTRGWSSGNKNWQRTQ